MVNNAFSKYEQGIVLIQLPGDIPVIGPAEVPYKLTLSKGSTDDEAKNKINLADDIRNHITGLTFSGQIKEAYILYDAAANVADISPDLHGRAKVNAAELYPYANTEDSSYATIQQRKVESLGLFNEVIDDTTAFSAELKGWAKCRVAKLYLENTFDVEASAAKQKAIALLQEVIADKDIGVDTKARAKIQLAVNYIHMKLDVAESDARQKATSLLTEVKSDAHVIAALKGEAALELASIKNNEDDPYNAQRLKTLKDLSVDPAYSASIQAKAKVVIARGLLNGEFDAKPSEAATMALTMYKEIIAEPKPDAKPEAKLDPSEYFSYKQEFALRLAHNSFHQKSKEAKDAAQALYTELLSDSQVTIVTDQKTAVKWQLALNYLDKKLDPPADKDARTAGVELINEIFNDSHVSLELAFVLKFNYARLHHCSIISNPLGLQTNQAKDEALQILNDLLNDSHLSGKQKEMVQAELDVWNGIVKR
ncbi:MAG: hypothetical protein V4482_02305 [Pseudomonadota bacterium]